MPSRLQAQLRGAAVALAGREAEVADLWGRLEAAASPPSPPQRDAQVP